MGFCWPCSGQASVRRTDIRSTFRQTLGLLGLSLALLGGAETAQSQGGPQDGGDFSQNAQAKELPTDVILVKGAWSSANDSTTPLPEGGSVANDIYSNSYFGFTYTLPPGWTQKYYGPPPSDSGYYVLAQITPPDTNKGPTRGSVLIAAQDLFFTLAPAENALELMNYTEDRLQPDYSVERPLTAVSIAITPYLRVTGKKRRFSFAELMLIFRVTKFRRAAPARRRGRRKTCP